VLIPVEYFDTRPGFDGQREYEARPYMSRWAQLQQLCTCGCGRQLNDKQLADIVSLVVLRFAGGGYVDVDTDSERSD